MSRRFPPTAERLQVVDFARTFSILSVLAYHMYGTSSPGFPFDRFWKALAGNGVYGVTVFFVISGYLITRLIDRRGKELFAPRFKEFYARRAARILPLLVLHISIGAYIVHNVTHFAPFFWVSILTFSFNWYQALHPTVVPGLYWGLLWSLSVEEQFYLFYPLVLKRIGRLRPLVFSLFAVVLLGLLWRAAFLLDPKANAIFFYKTSFGAFDQIATGVLLYLASKKFSKEFRSSRNLSVLACALGVLLTAGAFIFTNSNVQTDDIYSPSLVALGAFLFILGGLYIPFFESKYLVFLTWPGKYSYGIYLFHSLIYFFIYTRLVQHQNTLVAFVLFSAISTAVMSISYRYFEMPVNHWIRKLFGFGAVR